MTKVAPLLLAVAFFVAPSAYAQKSADEPSFRANSFWVYEIASHSERGDYQLRLQWTLLYQNREDNWVFARAKPDSELPPSTVRQITGVTDTAWSGRDATGPAMRERRVLSFPLQAGKTWSTHYTYARDNSTVQCEHHAREWESIKTHAGEFEAIRVEYRCAKVRDGIVSELAQDEVVKVTKWYAPAVQNVVRENMLFPNGGYTKFELSSYSLAK